MNALLYSQHKLFSENLQLMNEKHGLRIHWFVSDCNGNFTAVTRIPNTSISIRISAKPSNDHNLVSVCGLEICMDPSTHLTIDGTKWNNRFHAVYGNLDELFVFLKKHLSSTIDGLKSVFTYGTVDIKFT